MIDLYVIGGSIVILILIIYECIIHKVIPQFWIPHTEKIQEDLKTRGGTMSNPWNYVAGGLLAISFSLGNILLVLDVSGIQKGIGIVLILFIFVCVVRLEEHVINYEKHKSLDALEQPEVQT